VFLPASPNPAITLPTTRFVTQRTFPETLFAGDHAVVRRADSHLPLVILLVLSQLATGASVAALFVQPAPPLLLGSLVAGFVAMIAGSLHLGQPLKAWRSFLGWRKSWFSREVIALGAFVFLIALAAGAMWLPAVQPLEMFLAPLAVVAGLITVTCSAMIYVDTRREFWRAGFSFTKFFGTTLLLGVAATFATLLFTSASHSALDATGIALVLASVAKLAFERRIFTHLVDEETPGQTPLNKTARLFAGELSGFFRVRVVCGVLGGVVLPAFTLLQLVANNSAAVLLAVAALVFCVVGEFIERYLFFTAVVTQKMPGGLSV
jgi:DMSO reductase anchor subunit